MAEKYINRHDLLKKLGTFNWNMMIMRPELFEMVVEKIIHYIFTKIEEFPYIEIENDKCIYGKWIPVSERLPEDREIVIACWFNIHCIKKYNVSVLRFMKGRTLDEIEKGTPIYGSDQYGNNKVPYCWHSTEGAYDHFGQDVTHWMPLPEPPKEDTDG